MRASMLRSHARDEFFLNTLFDLATDVAATPVCHANVSVGESALVAARSTPHVLGSFYKSASTVKWVRSVIAAQQRKWLRFFRFVGIGFVSQMDSRRTPSAR